MWQNRDLGLDPGLNSPELAIELYIDTGLSLLDDISSYTRGFCAILSRDLAAQERTLPFTYGRPEESWSNSAQIYFVK